MKRAGTGQDVRHTFDRRATGQGAHALKYDILTAIGAHACGADKSLQRLSLRFITLIVARYNWATDELAVGQREMAALWAVDERSVKREIARLRALGWLTCRRPAARGRVAVHGLGLKAILSDTRPAWERVGSDYLARMAAPAPEAAPPSNVIAFPAPVEESSLWSRMQALLFRQDANLYGAWFAALRAEHLADGMLHLVAPSRFHASYITANHLLNLTRLAQSLDPTVARIEVTVAP